MKYNLYIIFGLFFFSLLSCKKNETDVGVTQVYSNDNFDLNGICALDAQHIYACGGVRWSKGIILSLGSNNQWHDTVIIDKAIWDIKYKDGFLRACGIDSKVYSSADSGKSWTTYQGWIWRPLYGLGIFEDGKVISVGGSSYAHGILYSSYGTGTGIQFAMDTIPNEIRDISVTGSQSAIVVGYGLVMYTNNGGHQWNYADVEGDFFMGVHFANNSNGMAVGYQGTIIKTNDGGITWKKMRNGNNVFNRKWNLNDIYCINDSEAIAVGDDGLIVKTSNAGKDWQYIECPSNQDLRDIIMIENTIYIVGTKGTILQWRL
jgi:hypothetical protein